MEEFIIKDGELICYNTPTLSIPNGVKKIGKNVFSLQPISAVLIPESVEYIADYAFGSCYKLNEVTILGNNTKIESSAFSFCYFIQRINCFSSIKWIHDLHHKVKTTIKDALIKGYIYSLMEGKTFTKKTDEEYKLLLETDKTNRLMRFRNDNVVIEYLVKNKYITLNSIDKILNLKIQEKDTESVAFFLDIKNKCFTKEEIEKHQNKLLHI